MNKAKINTNLFFALIFLSLNAFSQSTVTARPNRPAVLTSTNTANFPLGPDPVHTPGKLCDRPSAYRYPEHIAYCDRKVNPSVKKNVISDYDTVLGYKIRSMDRNDFKIDHFIPLSIGGSNDAENLWPQHKSVYQYSDPLEQEVSELITSGKIKQVEAVRVIKECKLNLQKCSELSDYLKSLN